MRRFVNEALVQLNALSALVTTWMAEEPDPREDELDQLTARQWVLIHTGFVKGALEAGLAVAEVTGPASDLACATGHVRELEGQIEAAHGAFVAFGALGDMRTSEPLCVRIAAVIGAKVTAERALAAAESRAAAAERDLTAIEAALDEAGTGNYSKATPEYLRSIPMLAKRVRILAHARDSHSKAFDASHAQLTRMGTEVSAACGFECIPAVRVTDVDVVVDGVRRTVAKLREDATAAERERDEARARVERADEAAMGALARSQAAHDVMTRAGVGGVGGYVKDRVALLISDRDSIRAKLGEAEKDREDWREQAIGNGKAYHAANAKLTRYAALESACAAWAEYVDNHPQSDLGAWIPELAAIVKAHRALSAPAPGAAEAGPVAIYDESSVTAQERAAAIAAAAPGDDTGLRGRPVTAAAHRPRS